jgi:hypothetical protein
MSSVISPYSPAFVAWTPLLLVRATPDGSQSIGIRCSTPAPMMWIHFSVGARRARSRVGRSQATSTSTSRIARPKSSMFQPKLGASRRATAGWRFAASA